MRIAYLTTCSPVFPTSGHSLRTYANWQALRALGEVRLYALNTHAPASLRADLRAQGIVPLPSRREPRPAGWARQAVAFATGKSVLYVKAMSPRRLRRLADEMRAWGADLLVVGETWLADLLPAFRGAVGRVVVDTHNVESRLYARVAAERSWPGKAKALLYGRNARGLEQGLAEADAVWAVSPADAEVYRRELGLRHVAVVPNGLDTDAYAPGRWAVEPGTVVCTGTYAYWPNQAAGMHLIGLSRRLDRDGIRHRMLLVGRDPGPMIEAARGAPSVTVTGPVDDVRPYIARAAVLAAPLTTGSGTKYKVLEALALGRPVLTTPVGSEGLDLRDGVEAAIATDLGAFDARLADLLRQPKRAEAMAVAGRAWMVQNHSLTAVRRAVGGAVAALGIGASPPEPVPIPGHTVAAPLGEARSA